MGIKCLLRSKCIWKRIFSIAHFKFSWWIMTAIHDLIKTHRPIKEKCRNQFCSSHWIKLPFENGFQACCLYLIFTVRVPVKLWYHSGWIRSQDACFSFMCCCSKFLNFSWPAKAITFSHSTIKGKRKITIHKSQPCNVSLPFFVHNAAFMLAAFFSI